jgi:hypothetical protein
LFSKSPAPAGLFFVRIIGPLPLAVCRPELPVTVKATGVGFDGSISRPRLLVPCLDAARQHAIQAADRPAAVDSLKATPLRINRGRRRRPGR